MPDSVSVWVLKKRTSKNNELQWKRFESDRKSPDEWRKYRDFNFPENPPKRRKPHKGDWIVEDAAEAEKPIAHYVSRLLLGKTGTLYRHDGTRWLRLIRRSATPKAAEEGAPRRELDLYDKPGHLGWVEGKKGDLLVTSLSPKDKSEARALLWGEASVAYKYIRRGDVEDAQDIPEGDADDAQVIDDIWLVRQHGEVSTINEKDLARRIKIENDVQDAISTIASNPQDWDSHGESRDRVRNALRTLFGPDVTGEIASKMGAVNLIGSMAGVEDVIPQASAHDTLGIGVKLVVDLYSIHKLLNSESKDRRELGPLSVSVAESALKAPPAVTAMVDVIGKLAQGGTQIAGIAPWAGTVMPLVGAIVGFEESARGFRKTARTFDRLAKIQTISGKTAEDEVDANSELGLLTQYVCGKLGRKATRVGASALAGLVGSTGGSILAVATAVGTANIWNPLGWTLAGVAVIGGTGVTAYILYRKVTKAQRHKKRGDKQLPTTPEAYAKRLISLYLARDLHWEKAAETLEGFGVPVSDGRLGIDEKKAINRIERHLTR